MRIPSRTLLRRLGKRHVAAFSIFAQRSSSSLMMTDLHSHPLRLAVTIGPGDFRLYEVTPGCYDPRAN